jgi:hypothetical protein
MPDERPFARAAGLVSGLLYRGIASLGRAVGPYLRIALMVLAIVLSLPSIAEYWLRHVRLPDVPVSAIVLLLVASFFILSFAVLLYTASSVLLTIQSAETTNRTIQARKRRQFQATDGSFSAATDEKAWQSETIEDLRKQGIRVDGIDLLAKNGVLKPEDQEAIEDMARAAQLRHRGRTE